MKSDSNETIDTITTQLLSQPPEQFATAVQAALDALRLGDLTKLGQSELARSALVTAVLLEPTSDALTCGRALQSVLRWGVGRLQPGGARSWHNARWRDVNILEAYYWQGARVADVAEWSGYSDIHVIQTLRPKAVAALAVVLRDELRSPQDMAGRQHTAVVDLIARLPAPARETAILLACFDHPVLLELLYTLEPTSDLPVALEALTREKLLLLEDTAVSLHPLVVPSARLQANPLQRQTWQWQAARYYVTKGEPLTAVASYREANLLTAGVDLLLTTWSNVVQQGDEREISRLQSELEQYMAQSGLAPAEKAQVQVIAGQVAESLGELSTAELAYSRALSSTDTAVKTTALHRLAELSKRKHHMDMALAYYQRGIALLSDLPPEAANPTLLARLHLDRAMIFLQEKQNMEAAQSDLKAADELAPTEAQALRADLHNAWASYYYQQTDRHNELTHRLQGWLTAVETGDTERMMKTAHNLGQAYAWRQEYQPALDYLRKSLALAEEAGNQQLIGANRKTIGNVSFWLQDWDTAETEYLSAHTLFVQMGSRNWEGYLAYELAELYATLDRWDEARSFWGAGQAIAAEIGNEMLAEGLQSLVAQFPLLQVSMNERQAAALAFVREHGRVTNRDYCELTNCAQVTAARDLKDLVAQGVLVKAGKGRGTFYALPA
jgi:tetratricopeptide (TPR) repeat protein